MNLNLPNDNGLEQSSPMSSSTQHHIPYHENKKCVKVKSTFFTFDLCHYTMNKYCENENPASEPHPFYFNHPLLLSYPHLTPILMLVFESKNAGFKCEHQTQMFNPWNKDPKLSDLKMSDSHIQPMELQLQTIQLPCSAHGMKTQTIRLPCSTHGMKTSNWHPTPMYNPWNKDLKPASNSHIQPME